MSGSGASRPWSTNNNRYLYTGREWDDTAKLFYFRARCYEPILGRFVQRDSLAYIDGANLYKTNFPLAAVDPTGHRVSDPLDIYGNKFVGEYVPPDPNGCTLEVCCKGVLLDRIPHGHCVIRFVMGDGRILGCRGGPSGWQIRNIPKECCMTARFGGEVFGVLITTCGSGHIGNKNPGEHGLGLDLDDALHHPEHCVAYNVDPSQCKRIRSCVEAKMLQINALCLSYGGLGYNSNSAWETALRGCLEGVPWLKPPGWQPGSPSIPGID